MTRALNRPSGALCSKLYKALEGTRVKAGVRLRRWEVEAVSFQAISFLLQKLPDLQKKVDMANRAVFEHTNNLRCSLSAYSHG